MQKVLSSLEDTNLVTLQWFHNFVADHPPLKDGDVFLTDLLAAQPGHVSDALPEAERISPAELAQRVLAQRKAMAHAIADGTPFAKFIDGANVEVLRTHLQRSTYVSGK